jgi:hypothetical protein
VILVLEQRGQRIKVPQDQPEGCQPLRAKDDVVAGQGKREEVGGEGFAVDGEGNGALYTRAWHTFPVRHCNLHVAAWAKLEGGASHGLFGDEVVGGS